MPFYYSSLVVKKQQNYTSVHEAVKAGDVEQLASMIKSGASINEVDVVHKFTPLQCAAHSGSLEVKHYVMYGHSWAFGSPYFLLWERLNTTLL